MNKAPLALKSLRKKYMMYKAPLALNSLRKTIIYIKKNNAPLELNSLHTERNNPYIQTTYRHKDGQMDKTDRKTDRVYEQKLQFKMYST